MNIESAGKMNPEEIIKQKDEDIKRLNESLGDLEFYLRDLSALIPIPICSLSPFDIIVDANNAFQKISEYSLAETTGTPIDVLFLEKKELKDILKRVVIENTARDQEVTLISKSGRKTPVSLSASLRRDQEGNILGYFLAFLDISERKEFSSKLELQVAERTKELQEKIKELEKINKLTVGRELKMVDLKKEIKGLRRKLEMQEKKDVAINQAAKNIAE